MTASLNSANRAKQVVCMEEKNIALFHNHSRQLFLLLGPGMPCIRIDHDAYEPGRDEPLSIGNH